MIFTKFVFQYLSNLPDIYINELRESPYIWKPELRSDWWRWFTYSWCHGSKTHLTMNLALQILLGIFVEFEHKVTLLY